MGVDEKFETTQIISLAEKRIEYGRCRHVKVLVDPDLEYVECKDCGLKLNPMNVLYRMCTEETLLWRRYKQYQEWHRKYEKRVRVRCEHCNKMTPVRVK